MTETDRERLLRIGAELADRGVFVPHWLLLEAISSTAMSDDGEGAVVVEGLVVVEEPGEPGGISLSRTEG